MCAQPYCMPNSMKAMTDEIIMQQISRGSRVIDLGCGDGRLLMRLRDEYDCVGQGIELDHEQMLSAIARGIPIINADLDEGLSDIPDDAFDCAVLSQTLQQVRHPKELLLEMMRIASRALVIVPNFGYWRVRLQVLRFGRTPITESLPYAWYNTPNLHFMSMTDFRALAADLNIQIRQERPIINGRAVDRAWAANLRADSALYVLERRSAADTP